MPPTLGWQRLRWAQLGAADSYLVTRDELAALGTGLLKNTTGTGVLSIAVGGTDYVVPGGVAGGQTIKGGTAAGENLTLQSTANATKGQTVIGVSGTDVNIDEVNHRFGLGVAAPETTVDIAGAISARGTNTISSAVDRIFMAYESGAVGGMAANSGRIEASRFGTFRELYLRGANVILQAGGSSAPYPLKAWSTGNVTINNNTDVATSALRVSGARTVASGASAVWDGVDFIASTLTISGSTNITTAAGVNFVVVRAPTLSAASALTVTAAATLTVENAPTGAGAGPATITNRYAFWVQAGNTRLAELQLDTSSRVSTQFDKTSSTALAAITGLTATLVAGATYSFEVYLYVSLSIGGGGKFDMSGTATATAVIYELQVFNNTGLAYILAGQQTALASSDGVTTSCTGFAVIKGTITVNAAGTLTPRFAQNVSNAGTCSVLVGSFMKCDRIA